MRLLDRICLQCAKEFKVPHKTIKYAEKMGIVKGRFCSILCGSLYNHKDGSREINCAQCFKSCIKQVSELKKSKNGNSFCGQSCAATYNNTHKTTGYRRSKLENYIEEKLRSEYPSLTIITNDKLLVNSELDFYFPQINLALEVNGIFHYKPIYGEDKLKRIQENDATKLKLCEEKRVKLIVFEDTTKNFNKDRAEERWEEIKSLLEPHLS